MHKLTTMSKLVCHIAYAKPIWPYLSHEAFIRVRKPSCLNFDLSNELLIVLITTLGDLCYLYNLHAFYALIDKKGELSSVQERRFQLRAQYVAKPP